MPADDRLRLELQLTPISDGEVEGERSLVLEAEIAREGRDEGGFTASGVLVGNYGIRDSEDLEMAASVEAFARGGAVTFLQVTVARDGVGASFTADLTLDTRADAAVGAVTGLAFLGWPDSAVQA